MQGRLGSHNQAARLLGLQASPPSPEHSSVCSPHPGGGLHPQHPSPSFSPPVLSAAAPSAAAGPSPSPAAPCGSMKNCQHKRQSPGPVPIPAREATPHRTSTGRQGRRTGILARPRGPPKGAGSRSQTLALESAPALHTACVRASHLPHAAEHSTFTPAGPEGPMGRFAPLWSP